MRKPDQLKVTLRRLKWIDKSENISEISGKNKQKTLRKKTKIATDSQYFTLNEVKLQI